MRDCAERTMGGGVGGGGSGPTGGGKGGTGGTMGGKRGRPVVLLLVVNPDSEDGIAVVFSAKGEVVV